MEITQHARYTCTFCGKVGSGASVIPMGWKLMEHDAAGLREAPGRWYLEVQLVQEGDCGRCMDCLDDGGCDGSQVRVLTLDVSKSLF